MASGWRDEGRRPRVTRGEFADAPPPPQTHTHKHKCPDWCLRLCPCLGPRGETERDTGPHTDPHTDTHTDTRTDSPHPPDAGLSVLGLNLCEERNRERHHTQEFEGDSLIVRRGQSFDLELRLNRPPERGTDTLIIQLTTGPTPQAGKGTLCVVTVGDTDSDRAGGWVADAMHATPDGLCVTLSVTPPPSCVIGQFSLSVRALSRSLAPTDTETATETQTPPTLIYVLFNPWCEGDSVYLGTESWRQEYVMNETGIIYYGTRDQIGHRTWNYGQFTEGVLEACVMILDKARMPSSGRGDPVNVTRVVSAMVNSVDDGGVLVGNWSGSYGSGTPPTAWVGSVRILLTYLRTERSVSYGQCWVFAGVTTTVLRCLGIPCRTVTNFSSAHDTDSNLTTDIYLDSNLEPIESMNRDSIWNFHVWNDCWMARPDLPPGLGGWQALDATPQETSSGVFCCGPASIEGIRNGLVYLKHDSPFIFAEVNSDRVFWGCQADGSFAKIHVERKAVGHNISTKAVGVDDREDITGLYKYPEDTEQERIAVATACEHGSRVAGVFSSPSRDIGVCVHTDDGAVVGSDFVLRTRVTNASPTDTRRVTLYTQSHVVYYTGVMKGDITRDRQELTVGPGEEQTVQLLVRYSDYGGHLVDQTCLLFTVTGRVQETGQVFVKQHTYRLRTPDLQLTALGEVVVGKEVKIEIVLTNPLPTPLKTVSLHLEGSGIQTSPHTTIGDIPSQATIKVTERVTPLRSGSRVLVANMDCRQLTQLHGRVRLEVQRG